MSTAEAECENLKARLAAAEKRDEGVRAAYECLLEALIQATIKLAKTEAEVANLEAERNALSKQLAATNTRSPHLPDWTRKLEAVLQSSSWRMVSPLRRIARIIG